MPTYLCHGFRWHRLNIRIFVILKDIDDAAPDWVIGYNTTSLILDQLYEDFDFLPQLPVASESVGETGEADEQEPEVEKNEKEREQNEPLHQDEIMSLPPPRVPGSEDAVLMHQWSAIKLLEEHDITETAVATRPYAYVADHAVRIELSADIAAEIAKYEAKSKQDGEGGSWFVQLRDKLQQGEEIRWYVVVCDDEERAVSGDVSEDEEMRDIQEAPSMEVASLPHRPASLAKATVRSNKQKGTATSLPTTPEEPINHPGQEEPPSQVPIEEQYNRTLRRTLRGKQSFSHGLRRLLGRKDKP